MNFCKILDFAPGREKKKPAPPLRAFLASPLVAGMILAHIKYRVTFFERAYGRFTTSFFRRLPENAIFCFDFAVFCVLLVVRFDPDAPEDLPGPCKKKSQQFAFCWLVPLLLIPVFFCSFFRPLVRYGLIIK